MGKVKSKAVGVMLILILIVAMLPIVTFAAEEGNVAEIEVNKNVQIVQIENEEYIIYVNVEGENLEKDGFSYAISSNSTAGEIDLNYIHSEKDNDNNQAALIDSQYYDFSTNGNEAYLWVKKNVDGEEKEILSAQKIDFSLAFKKSEMIEVEEKITKTIATNVVSDLVEEDRVDENGVHITVSIGGIQIEPSTDTAKYSYQIMPAEGEYATLMSFAEEIEKNYSGMDMYTKIDTANRFYKLYNDLKSKLSSDWNDVENMTIRQPVGAVEGAKYVVFIQETDGSATPVVDVQFMTCSEKQVPKYEKEKKLVQETSRLPITGDNMVLIIAFVVVAIALVFVFTRIKKLNKKENRKE